MSKHVTEPQPRVLVWQPDCSLWLIFGVGVAFFLVRPCAYYDQRSNSVFTTGHKISWRDGVKFVNHAFLKGFMRLFKRLYKALYKALYNAL